tara:strand:- start:1787 stop:1996 length:210 start_codon:yes stop_codon:yes gene_type:complete
MAKHQDWCKPLRVGYDGPQDSYYLLSEDGKRRQYLPQSIRLDYLVNPIEGGREVYGVGVADGTDRAAHG